jgi:hypothetical protein
VTIAKAYVASAAVVIAHVLVGIWIAPGDVPAPPLASAAVPVFPFGDDEGLSREFDLGIFVDRGVAGRGDSTVDGIVPVTATVPDESTARRW